jgi:hypothetical protein
MMAGAKQMPSQGEEIADGIVNREEPLGLCHRFEAPVMSQNWIDEAVT